MDDHVLRIELREPAGQLDDVIGRQALVDPHVVDSDADELAHGAEVAEAEGRDLVEGVAQEDLLAGDTPKIARRVRLPPAVDAVLQVARPGEGERLVGIEGLATQLGDPQAAVAVAYRGVEVQGHAANGLDQAAEAVEIHLDVVIDRDTQVRFDRVNQRLRALVVSRVDALGVPRRQLDPEIARHREHLDRRPSGVDPGDHDRVGALAARRDLLALAVDAGLTAVGRAELTRVGADHQEVRRLGRCGTFEVDVDPFDPAELEVPPRSCACDDRGDDGQCDQRAQADALATRPRGPPGPPRRSLIDRLARRRPQSRGTRAGGHGEDRNPTAIRPERASWRALAPQGPNQLTAARGSRGSPNTFSPTMLRWICEVPPQMVSDLLKKKAVIMGLTG